MFIGLLDSRNLSFDVNDFSERLRAVKIEIGYLSDLSFCPYIVCYKNPDNDFIVNNINEGFLNYIKENEQYSIIVCNDVSDFIETALSIKSDKILQNTLF